MVCLMLYLNQNLVLVFRSMISSIESKRLSTSIDHSYKLQLLINVPICSPFPTPKCTISTAFPITPASNAQPRSVPLLSNVYNLSSITASNENLSTVHVPSVVWRGHHQSVGGTPCTIQCARTHHAFAALLFDRGGRVLSTNSHPNMLSVRFSIVTRPHVLCSENVVHFSKQSSIVSSLPRIMFFLFASKTHFYYFRPFEIKYSWPRM